MSNMRHTEIALPRRARKGLVSIMLIALIASLLALVAPQTASAASPQIGASASHPIAGKSAVGPLKAADLSKFQAGRIIDDALFYTQGGMTEAQIQSFMNAKVPRCESGYTCLKDFKQTTWNKNADAMCKGYTGGKSESAARIIYKVSVSCNISAKVILVMLQKEQGLVTHVWPSDWRYDAALGQGCPDTEGCDPNFAGFFSQIYGAAWQLKRYGNPPGTSDYFTWFNPGKTWNIQWHPNAGCGTGRVAVQNKATSALYYYTPYQPNAAAIRAGYGEGDGCSAYGNRNFFQYYTDWFGSTFEPGKVPAVSDGLVQTPDNKIWLISGTHKYWITAEAYPQYKAVFAAYRKVTTAQLAGFTEGARAELFVRNSATNEIAYLDGNKTHWLSTCTLVEAWGNPCSTAASKIVNVTAKQFAAWGAGPQMTSFGRTQAGGRIHQVGGTKITPLYDAAAVASVNNGAQPFAAVMSAAMQQKYTVAPTMFAPGVFVRYAGTNDVFLPNPAGTLHHLPSWALAVEWGVTSRSSLSVPASDLKGYTKSTALSPFVTCGGVTYVGASGVFSPLSGAVPTGFTATALEPGQCSKLKLTGTKLPTDAVFAKFADSATVYHMVDGQYRKTTTLQQQQQITGGVAPRVLQFAATYRGTVVVGPAYPENGALVREKGGVDVFIVDGLTLVHLPAWAMAPEFGLPARGKETILEPGALSGLARGGSLTPFVSCGGKTYVAAGGKLREVDTANTGSNPVTEMSSDFCKTRLGSAVTGLVFLSDSPTTAALATDGGFLQLLDKASIDRAAAGTAPTMLSVSTAYRAWLPQAAVPTDGATTRATNATEVTFLSGGVRYHIPYWGVGIDLGIKARYEVVSPQAVAASAISSTKLSNFVTCGTTTYVAAKGKLYPITAGALGGATPLQLSAAACSTLDLTGAAIPGAILYSDGSTNRWVMRSGKLYKAAATDKGTVLVLDATSITGMLAK